ncbi:DUF2304 domain-containing protein [Vagococcus carniphilus]|uniref:DUF2304 domain-containing protein n=1 Tax=Vagococcus carniphilus TaxID=218144 RepID=UPI00288E854D|nr:DUF2304 domain-containing protein [Vagococcus carniphilus]MDT2830977.1 DUF2304 domain-containing protein [Vagococcus carniphilus]MDT2838126.1 DUF2304 domain-containing protein [Vagococcus carniphilus]MDT2853713.1 DUF2304 domain-containing protein [Vagococcus carniphilus]
MDILSITMIFFSLLFLIFIIKLIRNATFTLEHSLMWLGIGIIMLVFSVFPGIPEKFSELLGFETMSNFLLVMAVLFSLIQLIIFTKHITKQSNDIKTLVQELSILKEKIERKDK